MLDKLKRFYEDPESLAYFTNAQHESELELFECGVINKIDITSSNDIVYKEDWKYVL